ncbi:MAG: hypothetical protein UFG06_03425 [Lachnospiraceae bacterium]|nr:hypothetical protein [Lachnospiraceae bacterium]
MDNFYLVEFEYHIYLHQTDKEIYISVPAYDVFDKQCYVLELSEKYISFRYYNYLINYNVIRNSESIIFVDCLSNRKYIKLIKRITPEEYFEKSKKIDRLKLLAEDYRREFKSFINFVYEKVVPLSYEIERMMYIDDDFSKVVKGLTWLTNHIKHCCKDKLRFFGTASEIYHEALNKDYRMNCKNMALILNAVYLSAGIKSRTIECMQLEDYVDNCHYIVEAYILEWKKWILIDSSYGLLFKNQNNDFISLSELRQILLKQQEVNLISVAGTINKKLYLHNLIRKLYRFRRQKVSNDIYYKDSLRIELRTKISNEIFEENLVIIDNPDIFWEDNIGEEDGDSDRI